MASARTALAVLAALGVAALGAPRQKGNPYFHTCRYRGRHWDECVRTVTQDLRPLFVSGIPELGVRPIDPLFVDTFNVSEVSRKFRVNLQITNVSMHGLRDYTVTGVRSNLQELSLEIRLRVPNLSFRANYYMDGRFLFLALSGGGTCRYNLTDVDNNIVVNGHLVRRVSDDALHFRAATLRWTMMPSTGSSRFTSEGDASVYSHATSRLLNEHGVAALFQRAAERAFGEVLRERVNRLLMNIPYRDLFPPGVLPLHLLQRPMADSEVDEYPPLSWTRPATTTTTTTSTTTTTTTTTTSTTTLTPEIFITTTAPIKISPAEMPSRIDSPVGSVESHESGEWLGSDIPGRPEVPDTAVVIFKATDVSPDDDAETSTRGSSPEAISFGFEPQESTEVPTEISPLRPQAEDNPGVTANHQPVLATISDPDERSRRVNNSTTILNEGDVITVTSLDKHGVDPHDSQVQKVEPEAAVTELAATLELRPALPVQAHTATSLLGIPASPEVASQRLAIAPNLPAPAAAAPELVRSPELATLLEHSPPSALSDSPLSPEPGAPGVDYYDESDAGKTNDRIATFDTAFTLEGGSGVNTTSLPTVLQDQPAALAESTLDKALSTSVPSRPSAAVGNVYTDKTPVFIATTESLGQPVAVAENVFIVRETASTSGSLEHPAVVAENVYIEDKIPDRRSEYTVVSAEKTSDAEAGISTSRTPTSAFQHGDDETAAVPAGSASLPDLSDVGGPGVSGGHNAIPLDGDEDDPSYNETESSAETPVSGILVKGQSRPRSHVSDDNDDTTAADGETNMTLRTDVFSLGTLDEAVGEVARGLMDVLAMATEEPVAR